MELPDVLKALKGGRRVRVEYDLTSLQVLNIEADDVEITDLLVIVGEYNWLGHHKFVEKYCKSPNGAVPVAPAENGHTNN